MITYKQLTLAEIFEDCQHKFDNDKYQFLSLLMKPLTLMKLFLFLLFLIFMPAPEDLANISFIQCLRHFLSSVFSQSRRTHPIVFLKYSQELRDFCGFDVVPDGSKFTRFKQDFFIGLTIYVRSSC